MSNQKKLFTLTCLACGVYHALVLYQTLCRVLLDADSHGGPLLQKVHRREQCLLLLACWTNTRPDIGAHSSSRIEQGPLIPSDQRPWTTSNKHFIIRAKSLKNESTRARSRRVQQCPHQCATPAVRRCAGGLSAAALAVVMLFAFPPQSTTAAAGACWRGEKLRGIPTSQTIQLREPRRRKCVEIFKSDEFLCTWQQQRHRGWNRCSLLTISHLAWSVIWK